MLEQLKQRARTEFAPGISLAYLHAGLGQIDDGVTALEQAYHNREPLLSYAGHLFAFDPFRDHPRFLALLGRIFPPQSQAKTQS